MLAIQQQTKMRNAQMIEAAQTLDAYLATLFAGKDDPKAKHAWPERVKELMA